MVGWSADRWTEKQIIEPAGALTGAELFNKGTLFFQTLKVEGNKVSLVFSCDSSPLRSNVCRSVGNL